MIARLGPCRRVLVVAPHPDDETIGAFGLIHALRRRGARVGVVVVTDGGASHPGSLRWPPARLIPERRRETLRAMAQLGLHRSDIRFVGLADGSLTDRSDTLGRTLRTALRRMPPPDLIVGPVVSDAHADHRALARALTDRRALAARQLGYQVWPLGVGRRHRLTLSLPAPVQAAKRRAVRTYRTQMGAIADAPTGMTIRPHHLRAFAGPVERFERVR